MVYSSGASSGSKVVRLVATTLLAALAACSHFAAAKPSAPAKPSAQDKVDPRAQLSIGYSLLYQEAEGLPKLKWLLLFKEKSSQMGQLTNDLVAYYQHLAETMQKLSRQHPNMRLDVEPMSPIESEARKAIGADQAKDLAPLAGKAGLQFERETLLIFYDALNEQRHLVAVMARRETDPPLKEFLKSTQARMDELYTKVGALLDRRYFVH